ncbi:MAG TPA: S8 family serine peptidase [Verrucomicrobiae bacterium]|jgi:hypothetical protein|nr:S8 family serine peptidase [Verrucomicrobiae bacterium]
MMSRLEIVKGGVKGFNWRMIYLVVTLLIALMHQDALASLNVVATNAPMHKIQVSDPAAAKQIEASGGHLLADYGSYKLYETPMLTSKLLSSRRAELRDRYNLILLNAGHLDTTSPQMKAARRSAGFFTGKHLHLVQFVGPVQPSWRNELLAAGVQIISYIPENTYLVYGDAASLARVQNFASTTPHVQWNGSYLDDYKIHPMARDVDKQGHPRNIGTDLFEIQLVADDAANTNTLNLLNQLKSEPFKRNSRVAQYLNIIARLDAKQLKQIAAQPDVVAILPYFKPQKLGERADQIIAANLTGTVPSAPGYLSWLAGLGFTQAQFTASGLVVDISDSGVDNGTTLPTHFGLYTSGDETNLSRVVYARYETNASYDDNSLEGCDGHGTINAHIIAGYDDFPDFPFADTNGFHYGLGVCPFVNIGSSVIFDSADMDNFYFPNYNNLQSEAYHDGVRISNNSWGGRNSEGVYDSDCQNYDALVRDAQPTNSTYPADGNQPMVIVFAAGNDGPMAQSMDSPSTAKNVITVGAAEGVQAFGGADHSNIPDSQADSANDIAVFSSRGPCADGRFKPDLVAPGTHISGGLIQATNDLVNFPDGDADACFQGADVSGGPNGSIFWPSGQQFYTASSGTSHSTPVVSGGCALVMQYFLNSFTNLPSPAMVKAYLMNSARYLNGDGANDTLPSQSQGMGEMNLGQAFDGTPRILRDQLPQDLFTNSGQIRTVTGTIVDTNKPFCITLAWTDAPGTLTGNAYNNNLDLSVTVGTNTYKGNVFNGAYSATGGAADGQNNVESVFLPPGTSGNFNLTVAATSINSIGVPNTNDAVNQDFALVVYNAQAVSLPIVIPDGTSLESETCTNGAIDPGETVTVNFTLQNIGTANFSNLVATLEANTNITGVSAPQSYGALDAAGLLVSEAFTFTANGACGDTINATLQLQDEGVNVGTITFPLSLGKLTFAPTLMENFDELATPNLPPGWTSSATNAEAPWVSSTNLFDTAPNALFVGEPDMPGLSELDMPVIHIQTASAQLTFMNDYDFEAFPTNDPSPTMAFDGGVLEISVDGRPYADILAGGGSFVTGGYNSTITNNDANPLNNRAVWGGSSGGFIQTVVNLPANVAGHDVQLRWLFGTDMGNAYGGTGWYIDTVTMIDGYFTCCTPLVAPTISNPQFDGTNVTFTFQTVPGQTYSVQFKNDLNDSFWTTFQSVTGDGTMQQISDTPGLPQRFYRVSSP